MKWIPRLLEASLLCAAFWFAPAVSAADAALDTGRIEQLTPTAKPPPMAVRITKALACTGIDGN